MKEQKINVVFLVFFFLVQFWFPHCLSRLAMSWQTLHKSNAILMLCRQNIPKLHLMLWQRGNEYIWEIKKNYSAFNCQHNFFPNSRWNQTLISFAINSVSCNHLPLLHHYWSDKWHHVTARDSVFLSIKTGTLKPLTCTRASSRWPLGEQ